MPVRVRPDPFPVLQRGLRQEPARPAHVLHVQPVATALVMLLLKRSQGRCRRFNDLDISLYVTQHAILSMVKERHPTSFSLYTTSGGYKVMLMCRDFLDVKGGGIFGVVGGWKGEANYVKRRECCAELEIGVAPLRGDV